MLVRELMEHLSEVPPELPVIIGDGAAFESEALAVIRCGRQNPNKVRISIDPTDLFDWAYEFVVDALDRVR